MLENKSPSKLSQYESYNTIYTYFTCIMVISYMKITNLKRTYNIQHQRGIMFSNGFGTCPFKCGYFEIQLARVAIL